MSGVGRKKKPANVDLVRLKPPQFAPKRRFSRNRTVNGGRQEVCNILLGGLVSISKTLRCHQHPGRALSEPPLEVNVNLVTYHDISQLEKNMTVKRELVEFFNSPSADISESVLKILKGNQSSYKYVNASEVQENYFKATIKPNIWPIALSTKFEVQIIPYGSQSKVVAKTISQPYLFGDVAGFYDGYIQDFLSTLRTALNV